MMTPLHVSHSFEPGDSAVTVIGTEPPQSVVRVAGSDPAESAEPLIDGLVAAIVGPGTNNAWLGGGQAVIVITSDHRGELAAAGHDRSSVGAAIAERAVTRDGRHSFCSPDDLLLVAAGGAGLYSNVFPTWCAGSYRTGR